MKYLKRINEKKIGISLLKKEEFEAFLFDLMDISKIKIECGYFDPETLVISDIGKDIESLSKKVLKTDAFGTMISIEFLEINSIEKTSEFYNCLLEAVERFSEKYGDKFRDRDFVSNFLSSKIRQTGKSQVGYIFFIKS